MTAEAVQTNEESQTVQNKNKFELLNVIGELFGIYFLMVSNLTMQQKIMRADKPFISCLHCIHIDFLQISLRLDVHVLVLSCLHKLQYTVLVWKQ